MKVYLARLREALRTTRARLAVSTPRTSPELVPFHTPFPGMVRKAAALGYRHIIRDTDVELTVAEEIGRQPRPEEFKSQEQYYDDAVTEYTDALTETERYQAWYAETIEPTLRSPARSATGTPARSTSPRRRPSTRPPERPRPRRRQTPACLLRLRRPGRDPPRDRRPGLGGGDRRPQRRRPTADRYGSPSRSTSGSTTPTTTTPRPTSRNSPRPARSSSSTAGAAWASGSTGTFDN